MVVGDAANEADLRAAFKGVWGVFSMTFVLVVTGDLEAATEEEFGLGTPAALGPCSRLVLAASKGSSGDLGTSQITKPRLHDRTLAESLLYKDATPGGQDDASKAPLPHPV